jgi:hypothetical protein
MWWAAGVESKLQQAIQDRWRAACLYLIRTPGNPPWTFRPTQMAIPLQMDLNPEQLVAESKACPKIA